MQICDPSTARRWFRLREPVNLLLSLSGFAILCGIMWVPLGPAPAVGVSAAAMYCVHRFGLRNRAIAIRCPHCARILQTNTPWICGSCYWKNLHANEYPFVHRCEHYDCGAEPKAYLCHHCGEPIFFTEDRQIAGCAVCVNLLPDETPDAGEHEGAVLRKKQEIELKELEIKEAALNAQLRGLTQSEETPKRKSIDELYRETVRNDDDARRLRAAIDEEFKDDPKERERRHRHLDDIMRDRL